jgi:hypothetical protein
MDDPKIYSVFSRTDNECNVQIVKSEFFKFGAGERLEFFNISTNGHDTGGYDDDNNKIAGIHFKTNRD